MASSTSTFATLRALHLVIADALDDIQRVFSQNGLHDPAASPTSPSSSPVFPSSPTLSPLTSPFPATPPASFPPTPLSATFPSFSHTSSGTPFADYPSPDLPHVPNSQPEQLALHPDAVAAANRIVAACGQMSSIVHKPFLTLCDAILSYNLPACMRLVEHLHVAEILREAEDNRQRFLATGQSLSDTSLDRKPGLGSSVSGVLPRDNVNVRETLPGSDLMPGNDGLHVADITDVICSYVGINYVDPNELVHVLRLLSTHHIFRETAPDTFALNRVASLLDSGKSVWDVFSDPEIKYDDTGGIPAFVALSTDELFKSAAYLTEAFTGVQLPGLGPKPDSSFPVDVVLPEGARIPSTANYALSDRTVCLPTARSSSILTHIMYPEEEDVQLPSRSLLTDSPENVTFHSLSEAMSIPSQPSAVGPSAPRSHSLYPSQPLMQTRERVLPENLAKPEKLLAFNLAFHTSAPYFEWLENGGQDLLGGAGEGARIRTIRPQTRIASVLHDGVELVAPEKGSSCTQQKSHRLQRFSNAMKGSIGWEAPKAILGGFDWYSLPKGSTIIDIGGGIGSTTMVLARALNSPRVDSIRKQDDAHSQPTITVTPRHKSKLPSDPLLMASDELRNNTFESGLSLRFVVQDRPVVTSLGIEAWRSKCPEMLESGQVVFQDQDFFEPQIPLEQPHMNRHPSIYLLRVVLHDWPDEAARRILINLRVASNADTRLVIAEHVLPLACADEDVLDRGNTEECDGRDTEQWTLSSVLANIEGAERTLAAPPLLSNLGKASAHAYWMDLTMHISLNGKERTLREFCALALSAGWRITRMTRPEGLLFAYLVCEPIPLPDDAQAIYNAVVLSSELSTMVAVPSDEPVRHPHVEPLRLKPLPERPVSLLPSPILVRSSSRCGTPTFGSRMLLPKDEELQSPRSRGAGAAKKWLKSRGLGVRGVVMQKVEKQREEQNSAKADSTPDNSDTQGGAPTTSSHVRVWWKKTSPSFAGNSNAAVHESNTDTSEHRPFRRLRRSTLKSSDTPSTPSPKVSSVHHQWPSAESATLPAPEVSPIMSQARRPSVASITRKLSFATFGRRPSVADINEPLPTPPPSATLAPPPNLRGNAGRSLKHLPSLPTFGRNELSAATGRPPIPRRPSLNFAHQAAPAAQPVVQRTSDPRRADVTDSPKSGILKSRSGPHVSKQGCSAEAGSSLAESSTSVSQRQRRVTLSNSPGVSPGIMVQSPLMTMGVPSTDVETALPEARRVPSVPKLPRRLSIPMLRRKNAG